MSSGLIFSSALLMVLRLRVMSAIERMSTFQDFTPVSYALKLFLDIDLTVTHAAHKFSALIGILFCGHFIKFALFALHTVTENRERFVTREQFGFTRLVNSIIEPTLLAAFFLLAVALINGQIDAMLETSARYVLYQRSRASSEKKLIKELQIYSKTGGFTFNVFDFPVRVSTLSKIVALGTSLYIVLLRFKRWGII